MEKAAASVSVVSAVPQTIAQGLKRMKVLKGYIAELESRATKAVRWVGENHPAYVFDDVVAKRRCCVVELTAVNTAVEEANSRVKVEFHCARISLKGLIKRRAECASEITFLRGLSVGIRSEEVTEVPSAEWDDTTGRRVPVVRKTTTHFALTEVERDEQIEDMEKLLAELDSCLEAANHRTRITLSE